MAKITRKTLEIFGISGASTNFGQFGSKAAAAEQTSKDPTVIQALAAWANGWQDAVLNTNKAPYQEDMNGLCYVLAYMLGSLFQDGISVWDVGTTYYIGSVVRKDGTFEQYGSLTDNNLGNALPSQTDNAQWKYLTPATILDGGVTVNAIPKVSSASPGKVINSALTDDGVNVGTTLPIKFPDNTIQSTAAVNGAVSAQNVVTGIRVLSTVYHNTTAKPIYVCVTSPQAGSPGLEGYTDTSPTPTTLVSKGFMNGVTGVVQVFFIVLPGSYYKVVYSGGGSPGFATWLEWT